MAKQQRSHEHLQHVATRLAERRADGDRGVPDPTQVKESDGDPDRRSDDRGHWTRKLGRVTQMRRPVIESRQCEHPRRVLETRVPYEAMHPRRP
jgi:hypothetical protein